MTASDGRCCVGAGGMADMPLRGKKRRRSGHGAVADVAFDGHHDWMKRCNRIILKFLIGGLVLLITFPFWGMGPAVFLDSKRTVLSSARSPDGQRTAQVERLIVGGVPNIVVTVRASWLPDWYLAGCAAISHYRDARTSVAWNSNDALTVTHTDERRFWRTDGAPFHLGACDNLSVLLRDEDT